MTIEKHGNKYRITKMVNGIRYHVSVSERPTKREAEALIMDKIDADDPTGNRKDTFEKSAERYISIKSNVLSPSTIRGYKSIMSNLSDRFINTKTCNISQELIQKEINDYSATHSAKSTHNAHGFISAVLSVYKPSLRISTTLPQKVKYDAYTPSEDEVKQILSSVNGTYYEIPFRLGCYGLRTGEICALTAADLDGNFLSITKSKALNSDNKWVIKPIPKTTGSQRTIYIDDYLAAMLNNQGYAFQYDPRQLNRKLHREQKRLQIPEFRFHDLRAYYVTMGHSLGIPDKYLMASGGWASANIMNRVYKRTFAEKQAEANRSIADHLTPEF